MTSEFFSRTFNYKDIINIRNNSVISKLVRILSLALAGSVLVAGGSTIKSAGIKTLPIFR